MRKEDKNSIISSLADTIQQFDNFYLTDISTLNAAKTSALRAECFQNDIKLVVVKNTLLTKALDSLEKDYTEIIPTLKGNTAIMFSNVANTPAKVIEKLGKEGYPKLKAAYVQESFYIGSENLKALVNIKSKNELIADVVALLQSPIKNVVSSLQSGANTIHGVLETLSKK